MRKIKLITIFSLIAVFSGGCSTPNIGKQQEKQGLEEITVILDYLPNTNHTGLYVALKNGYYESQGLDVTIIEPSEGATATLVALGNGDFGISYQEDVTLARVSKEPLPIKAIAAVIQNNTSGFASYKEKNITSIKDFEGKTYAGWGGPGEEAVLKSVMEQEGLNFDTLDRVISDGSGFSTLKEQVDMMWFYEAWDNIICEMNDFDINYMPLRDLDERLNFYTPVIITNETMMEQKPETVRKFLVATEQGYEYAIERPEESAQILNTYVPEYGIEMLTKSQVYLADKYKEDSKKWGVMESSVWDNYTEFMLEYGVIEKNVDAEECYTNTFLPD